MDTLTHEHYVAIEKYANDLKICYENYLKNSTDEITNKVLNYCITILKIHLDLAQSKFDAFADQQAKEEQCQK